MSFTEKIPLFSYEQPYVTLKNDKKEKRNYGLTVKGEEENCVAWKLRRSVLVFWVFVWFFFF